LPLGNGEERAVGAECYVVAAQPGQGCQVRGVYDLNHPLFVEDPATLERSNQMAVWVVLEAMAAQCAEQYLPVQGIDQGMVVAIAVEKELIAAWVEDARFPRFPPRVVVDLNPPDLGASVKAMEACGAVGVVCEH
jgi:hypothetical protein